jgi:ParB-like chromosome segregation protein Spo0J
MQRITHTHQRSILGEIDPGESFIKDIRRNGVETPLIVNDHPDTEAEWDLPNTVIGGHRRLEAARRVGLEAVPVKWESYPEPLATRRLILNNLQRTKNDAQQAKEMLMLEDTAREMSLPRLKEAGGDNRLRQNFDEGGDDIRWDKEVADDVGVSRQKVRYTTDVFRFADPDEYVHDDLQNPGKYDVDKEVRELARKKIEQIKEIIFVRVRLTRPCLISTGNPVKQGSQPVGR